VPCSAQHCLLAQLAITSAQLCDLNLQLLLLLLLLLRAAAVTADPLNPQTNSHLQCTGQVDVTPRQCWSGKSVEVRDGDAAHASSAVCSSNHALGCSPQLWLGCRAHWLLSFLQQHTVHCALCLERLAVGSLLQKPPQGLYAYGHVEQQPSD
jgi:hypothetical protein